MAYIFINILISNLVSNLCKNFLCIAWHQKPTVKQPSKQYVLKSQDGKKNKKKNVSSGAGRRAL